MTIEEVQAAQRHPLDQSRAVAQALFELSGEGTFAPLKQNTDYLSLDVLPPVGNLKNAVSITDGSVSFRCHDFSLKGKAEGLDFDTSWNEKTSYLELKPVDTLHIRHNTLFFQCLLTEARKATEAMQAVKKRQGS